MADGQSPWRRGSELTGHFPVPLSLHHDARADLKTPGRVCGAGCYTVLEGTVQMYAHRGIIYTIPYSTVF